MNVNCRLIAEDSRDCSDDHDREIVSRRELGRFGKGQIKDDRIVRRANKVKGKIKRNKGADLKGLSVTHRILSACRKDKKEGYETFEEPKGHTSGGQPKRSTVLV